MFISGTYVNVYEDPLTQTKLEGRAKLLTRYAGPDREGYWQGCPLERWTVEFEGDDLPVQRLILDVSGNAVSS